MRKTGALLVLLPILFVFLSGQRCVLEPDREFVYTDTTMVVDTVEKHDTTFVYRDTLRLHDTTRVHDTLIHVDTFRIHDTTRVHDTVAVHDTLRTFAVATTSDQLFGVWEGTVSGKYVRLAITRPSQYSTHVLEFNCNVAATAYDGYFSVMNGSIASSGSVSGPSVYGESASWVFSVVDNVLTLQQSGFQMFPTMQAFTLNRIQ